MKSSCVNEEISKFNHLNTKLNPICHLLALLGAHHILHVSRIRVNRKLAELVKHVKRVSLVEIDPNRESFTEHRLHLSSSEKDIISKQLALHILLMLEGGGGRGEESKYGNMNI
jgi:hypothetical protein